MNILKIQINKTIKWALFLALVLIYVFPNMYNMMSLDYTGYAHIAKQLSIGNWSALFNLTWSSLMSFFASLFMRLGFDVHVSFVLIKTIFIVLSFKESNLFVNTNYESKKIRIGLKIILLCIIFYLSTSNTDILFFYFTLSIINSLIFKSNLKFTISAILLVLTRPLGLYLVFFVAIVDIFINRIQLKKKSVSILNYVAVIVVIAVWSILMGRNNNIGPTMGWAGKYNLTLVSPENQKAYSLNYDEKYKQLADIYHGHMLYKNDRKENNFYKNTHHRRIDQWKWLDISYHLGKSITGFDFTLSKMNILHFTKWYITNLYIYFKDYIFLFFATFFLIFQMVGIQKKIVFSLLLIAFLYLSMFLITHIETRYILTPTLLIIFTILYFNDGKWFSNFQYVLVFNLLFFKQWVQVFVFFVSGFQNIACKTPYFLGQKFNQETLYVSTGNLPPSLLVINNPKLKCVGYIQSRDDFWKISDSTIALLEFKSDTAYFTHKIRR